MDKLIQLEKIRSQKSPTMEAIRNQKCKISFIGTVGGETKTRLVDGDNWRGSEYNYEIIVPREGQEDWTTELRVWGPLGTVREDWKPKPDTQIYIQTGRGEMLFTDNKDDKEVILDEINRQMELAKQEK